MMQHIKRGDSMAVEKKKDSFFCVVKVEPIDRLKK